MQLFYFRSSRPNFGDDLNAWMWHEVSPGLIDANEDELLVGVGTLLADDVPSKHPRAKAVHALGSGAGYWALPDVKQAPWSKVTVRGPVTAKLLGLPADAAGTDSAILLAGLREFSPLPESQRDGVLFMPHFNAPDRGAWRAVCAAANVTYADPSWDSRALVHKIRESKLVLADAMHAAIVSDTVRVPWIPIATSAHISTAKWLDWAASMSVPYEPNSAPPVSVRARAFSRFLAAYDAKHEVTPPTVDNPLLYARPSLNRTTTNVRRVRNRVARTVVTRASRTYEAVRRPAFESCAAAGFLASLKSRSGYLSSDEVFTSRLALMQERLRELA